MIPGHYRNLKVILDTGKYEVNIQNGTVIDTKTGKQLKETTDKFSKSQRVTFHIYDDHFIYVVHHIVMVAAGHDITGKTVIHIDGNKLNNSIDNLKLK